MQSTKWGASDPTFSSIVRHASTQRRTPAPRGMASQQVLDSGALNDHWALGRLGHWVATQSQALDRRGSRCFGTQTQHPIIPFNATLFLVVSSFDKTKQILAAILQIVLTFIKL